MKSTMTCGASWRIWLPVIFLMLISNLAVADTIIYLHGRIVEDEGPQAVSERFGLYDYPAIVEALAANGATVVSTLRPSGTKAHEYAEVVVDQVKQLIESGESPESITVVGFSKGGSIAIFASSALDNPEVNFVFIAACADWISSAPDLSVSGNILSINEKSDDLVKSCEKLLPRNENASSFTEFEISTGKEHGAFYLPRAVWIEPLLAWIEKADK